MSIEGEAEVVTEPVAEVVAEPVTPEVEAPEDAEEEGEEEPQDGDLQERKPRVRNAQGRIDQLTREKSDLKRELDRIRLATAPAPPSAHDAASTKPTSDQFETWDEFTEALTDWKVDQKFAKQQEATQESLRAADWDSKLEAAKSNLSDFDKVVGSSEINLRGDIVDAIRDADRGPELAYHMATHPEVAERLNSLPPRRALMELGVLEVQLSAPVVKPATRAPAPISPLTGGQATMPNLAKADMDTYIAQRRAQGAKF